MRKRIGLYGGSFNPIHCGHLIAARCVAEAESLDQVYFLPSADPPHKRGEDLLDAAHRARMVRLAIQEEPLFAFHDFDLTRPGPTYTFDTVKHFTKEFGPRTEIYWLIGADSLPNLIHWHRFDEIIGSCQLLIASRLGGEGIDWSVFSDVLSASYLTKLQQGVIHTPIIDISSTDIRRRIQREQSIAYLIPQSVHDYIKTHRLYV